jgi:hypothetical protein
MRTTTLVHSYFVQLFGVEVRNDVRKFAGRVAPSEKKNNRRISKKSKQSAIGDPMNFEMDARFTANNNAHLERINDPH